MAHLALIDYGSGNLRSAEKALARAAHEGGTGMDIRVTSDPDVVKTADRIVLPGVGAFADCMAGLSALPGMTEALKDTVLERRVPFLGICVGMQLLATIGVEFGKHEGLGWIPGEMHKLEPSDPALKIPHMGWNNLMFARPHPLFSGVAEGADVYFVHSYHFKAKSAGDVVATVDYGGPVVAAIARGNIAGFQFHPEKSQTTGQSILRNYLTWKP